jgi:hypothetical protein
MELALTRVNADTALMRKRAVYFSFLSRFCRGRGAGVPD